MPLRALVDPSSSAITGGLRTRERKNAEVIEISSDEEDVLPRPTRSRKIDSRPSPLSKGKGRMIVDLSKDSERTLKRKASSGEGSSIDVNPKKLKHERDQVRELKAQLAAARKEAHESKNELQLLKASGTRRAASGKVICPAPARKSFKIVTAEDARRHGVPSDWTFGLPEQTHLDLQALMQCMLDDRDDEPGDDIDEMTEIIKDVALNHTDPIVYGAHPEPNDPSVRYTFVDNPPGQPWLTLRWWSGRDMGYYFDLVDLDTRAVLLPPKDLIIEVHTMMMQTVLVTVEEGTRRARRLAQLGGTGEERYLTPHGSQLFFYRIRKAGRGRQTHRELVAEVIAPYPPAGAGQAPRLDLLTAVLG
ncbi:hypothetical protein EWM64_g6119 [Hericium alpestre]|uniref:Uncharacterized protein n=1 Tax=Hericium alpestre TaxID=135208 RepID=A0A4Y9ZTJ1_9AGAM|nr:hypothetical protein EWM64_g6119 [Hericium alpestre]